MPSNRQDAWSPDEDLLLAEVVLRHIREGGTQLKAFEEVAKQLSRTPAACGFRWNSFLRKKYKEGIELAKKQRKELKKQAREKVGEFGKQRTEKRVDSRTGTPEGMEKGLRFEEVINYLKDLHRRAEESTTNSDELEKYKHKVHELEKKVYHLAAENEKLTKELQMMEKDYTTLIEIMERARKMVSMQDANQGENGKKQE